MKNLKPFVVMAALGFVTLSSMSTTARASGKLINVQGKLTDGAGNPISGSPVVTFRLYRSISDPVTSAIWMESQGVTTQNGLFSAPLGRVTSLDPVPFNTSYYLGMQVAGDANEMTPRQLLGAAAFALGSLGDFAVQGNITSSGSITTNGNITSKGIVGTTTNDNAAAGNVGELVESVSGYTTMPASDMWGDLTSITVSAGDWDVTGVIQFDLWEGVNLMQVIGAVTKTPGNSQTGMVNGSNEFQTNAPTVQVGAEAVIPNWRVSVAGPTNLYLKIYGYYSSGRPKAQGRITARRVR